MHTLGQYFFPLWLGLVVFISLPIPFSESSAMISQKEAQNIASKAVEKSGETFVCLEDRTRTLPFGWVFVFVTSNKYAETGEIRYSIPGMGPILVDMLGKVKKFGARPPHIHKLDIQSYQQEWYSTHYGGLEPLAEMHYFQTTSAKDSKEPSEIIWFGGKKQMPINFFVGDKTFVLTKDPIKETIAIRPKGL